MPFPVLFPGVLPAGAWQLRAIADDDRALEQELSRDDEVVRWTFYPPGMSDERAAERIRRTRERAAQGQGARYVVLGGPDAAGTAGIALGNGDRPEVFYALLPRGRGRGAATAAARALSDWALGTGLPAVWLLTLPGNVASEAVAERAGFEHEGTEPGEHRGEPVQLTRWVRRAAAGRGA